MRRSPTEADLDRLVSHLQFHGEQTKQVLDSRIGQPLPGHVIQIRIDHLDPDPRQPRRSFPEQALRELAQSIGDQGILQPILVRSARGGRYLIIAGERRFRAARLAALDTVPCMVHELTDDQALVLALMENLHREELTDMEKTDALAQLRELTTKTWEEISDLVRLSVSRVTALAALQRLAEPVKEQVRSGALSGFKARVLLPLDPPDQVQLAARAATENLSEPELRSAARKIVQPRAKPTLQSTPQENPRPEETRGSYLEIEEEARVPRGNRAVGGGGRCCGPTPGEHRPARQPPGTGETLPEASATGTFTHGTRGIGFPTPMLQEVANLNWQAHPVRPCSTGQSSKGGFHRTGK